MKQESLLGINSLYKAIRARAVPAVAILLIALTACSSKVEDQSTGKDLNQRDFIPLTVKYISDNPDSARALQEALNQNSGGNLEELIKEGRVFQLEEH